MSGIFTKPRDRQADMLALFGDVVQRRTTEARVYHAWLVWALERMPRDVRLIVAQEAGRDRTPEDVGVDLLNKIMPAAKE